jgi:4'-phosphopantetheinyl transferase
MPIVLNKYENTYRLALWSLTEPLEFFEQNAKMTAADLNVYQSIGNNIRKKEWLAVRVLLNEVLGFWPQINYSETGKPLLRNHSRHLSISHSRSMVGILLSTNPYVGIDIEKNDRNIEKVSARFLSEAELEQMNQQPDDFSRVLYWCAKEAIYKAVSEYNVLFSKQIFVREVNPNGIILAQFSSKIETLDFQLNYMVYDEHMVVWTI